MRRPRKRPDRSRFSRPYVAPDSWQKLSTCDGAPKKRAAYPASGRSSRCSRPVWCGLADPHHLYRRIGDIVNRFETRGVNGT